MDTTLRRKPMTMAELLPELSGIVSKESMQMLSVKKQPRQTTVLAHTDVKTRKPLTLAEMWNDIQALRVNSPKKAAQGATTSKKKYWNSSVKIDKTVSHTAKGQLKNNPVRKVLNFQPKPKAVPNVRATIAPGSPKFTKPELRAKKALPLQARNDVRISGVYKISETPIINKPLISRMTIANKENVMKQPRVTMLPPPKPLIKKKLIPVVPDTPVSNISSDSSFLLKEKEINDAEEKMIAIEERTLENLAEVTPPASTPFKDYRNVQEFFNNSSEIENTAAYHDDTIMCFDKTSENKVAENKREESVIVSLCDLLNKATVTNKMSTELEDLLLIEKQTENNLKMIEDGIATLNRIKESHLKSLRHVRKLINEKKSSANADETLTDTKDSPKAIKEEKLSPGKQTVSSKRCSVIRSSPKSPSYIIPRKNTCLRKKVIYKSMPNVNESLKNEVITPIKYNNRAQSMYMKMKEHINFLATPVAKPRLGVPDTPAVTSHNLQKQLDKLYGDS